MEGNKFNEHMHICNCVNTKSISVRPSCKNDKGIVCSLSCPHIKKVDKKIKFVGLCWLCWKKKCNNNDWSYYLSKCANIIADKLKMSIEERESLDVYKLAEKLGLPSSKEYNHFHDSYYKQSKNKDKAASAKLEHILCKEQLEEENTRIVNVINQRNFFTYKELYEDMLSELNSEEESYEKSFVSDESDTPSEEGLPVEITQIKTFKRLKRKIDLEPERESKRFKSNIE